MFKVGDKVVYETYAILEVMDESGDGFFELSNFAYVHFSEIRHATPEEIAAGCRMYNDVIDGDSNAGTE